MKLIHLSDLHIGKSLGDFDLIEDQKYILGRIADMAEEKGVDAVLMAGDIYDRTIPSEAAVRLFDQFIRDLVRRNIRIYVIPGNHDSDERLNFGASLFEASQVYICASYDGRIRRYECRDEYGKLFIYLMPFIKASQVRHFYPEEEITSYDQAVRIALAKTDIDPEERNILVAHQFVTGSSGETELAGSEGLAARSVGLVEMVGDDCFSMFDYVALGHIHAPQKVGREEVRYAGSPLKYSLSEAGRDKSVPIVTIGEKGQVDIELIKLEPRRDLVHIRGRMDQLLGSWDPENKENLVYATLTDEDVINDAMGIFRQYYPNMVRIDYDNSHTRELSREETGQVTEDRSFTELISDFYRQMYGCEISEDELAVIKAVAKEAGVADET